MARKGWNRADRQLRRADYSQPDERVRGIFPQAVFPDAPEGFGRRGADRRRLGVRDLLAGDAAADEAGFNDEFIWPLVILNHSDKYVVQLGLSVFFGEHFVEWGPMMAASSLVSLPVIALFLFTQASMVKSIATTGMKG